MSLKSSFPLNEDKLEPIAFWTCGEMPSRDEGWSSLLRGRWSAEATNSPPTPSPAFPQPQTLSSGLLQGRLADATSTLLMLPCIQVLLGLPLRRPGVGKGEMMLGDR